MQCVEKSLIFPEVQPGNSSTVEEHEIQDLVPGKESLRISHGEQFTIEAFLPMAQADLSKIGNGQYVSIDARPVSHEKGTMKKIITLYKKYIRGSLAETSDKVKNPFIRLNIKCPIASYDSNVEPAKDDVLFGNESLVLESVESLLKGLYGECKIDPALPVRHLTKKLDDFELLLARRTPSASTTKDTGRNTKGFQSPPPRPFPVSESPPATELATVETSEVEVDNGPNEQASRQREKWNYDMSTDYSEEVEGFERRSHPNTFGKQNSTKHTEMEMGSSAKNDLNPWIIAKMTAPVTRNVESSSEGSTTAALGLITPGSYTRPALHHEINSTPTPHPRQSFRQDDVRLLQPSVATFSRPKPFSHPNFESALTMLHRPEISVSPDREVLLVDAHQNDQLMRINGAARNEPEPFPMSPPPTLVPKGIKKLRGPNKPFISPLKMVENRVVPHNTLQTKLSGAYLPSGLRSDTVEQPHANVDLAWAMDFEERKEAATRRRREELRSVRPADDEPGPVEATRSSPHKNRYNAAIACLEVGQQPLKMNALGQHKEPFKTSLPDDDPRAYLMRRQKSMPLRPARFGDSPKLMCAKSTKLPMERIPRDAELYHLLQNLPVDMSRLKRITSTLTTHDTYTNRGTQSEGLNMKSKDIPGISQRLQEMVRTWVGNGEGKGYEVEFTLGDLLSTNSLRVA
jgi:hypothetical protein